jgi:uncharacterized sodium:solute symporter family permease YidK
VAQWVAVSIVILVPVSLLHEPFYRRLVDDEDELRTWCIVQYSQGMKIFDSAMHIFHFFAPLSINLISAVVIILLISRTQSTARKNTVHDNSLRTHFLQHKHLIISPIVLALISVPRLVTSFLSGCMESFRNTWLFLIGYFISFMPSVVTLIVFIWPSTIYKREFYRLLEY